MKFAPFICALALPLSSLAQTFIIGDSATTVTNPAGISAGDSIIFQGNINVPAANAVDLDLTAIPAGVNLTFQSGSTTVSGTEDSVAIDGLFNGNFTNLGSIVGGDEGIDLNGGFSGNFTNRGTIRGDDSGFNVNGELSGRFVNSDTITGDDEGVDIDDDMSASFINSGTILGGRQAVDFNADLTGSFLNSGLIRATDGAGIEVEGDLTGSFTNTGIIIGDGEEGVDIFEDVTGSFLNTGTIIGGGLDGVFLRRLEAGGIFTNSGSIIGSTDGIFMRRLDGALTNSGSIIGQGSHGIHVRVELAGTLSNTGSIQAAAIGVIVNGDVSGLLYNCGIIEGTSNAGIRTNTTTGTIWNDGGRVQGGNNAINMLAGSATVILSGPSHIVGNMQANGVSDILRFQGMRGITATKEAELLALAAADSPAQTSVTLFGETISWVGFEDIQADAITLESYSSLITGPGLQNYVTALDNVLGLNDSFREFLKGLNKAEASQLNEIVANSSGQTLITGLNDFARNQDSRIFSLLSNEFSTLRGGVSGAGLASSGEPSGLFAREVPVGATITPMDDSTDSFIAGYVGRGTQNRSLTREESSYDNTTILFGVSREVSSEWQVGLFGGYTDNENAVDGFGSLLKNEAAYFGVNAQYTTDYYFANFVAAYGYHDQMSTRRDFLGNSMEGDTIGHQGMLFSQVGQDLLLGEEGNAKLTPYFGFSVSSLSMGDYTETGPVGTSLRFADESTTSVQTAIGINASCSKETSYGWVKPRIDAAWWHEYTESGRYGVSLASPGLLNSFDVFSPSSNRNRGLIQIGTEIGFDCWENVSFDLSYFGTTGEDGLSAHGGALSATFEF